MTVEPGERGPVAYCMAALDVYHDDPAAHVVIIGCVLNPDGTLMVLVEGTETVQFNVTVPLGYGDNASAVGDKVMSALEASYGVTGLADVKFVPAF